MTRSPDYAERAAQLLEPFTADAVDRTVAARGSATIARLPVIAPAYIPSPSSNGFHLGPLFVHAYGLAYVFAVAAAILVTRWGWRRRGGDPNLPQETAVWAFPAGLIGGRIYFLITTPSQIPPHWWGPFAIWKGGLGIWGGIAGGALVGIWYVRRRLGPERTCASLPT